MRPLFRHSYNKRTWLWVLILGSAGASAYLIQHLSENLTSPPGRSIDPSVSTIAGGPPWIYGSPDARFTVVVYADFACPYCRSYLPTLKQWIRDHPETNWQWHHLPISSTDAESLQHARFAECAGEAGGNVVFWDAVSWILAHKDDDPARISIFDQFPGMSRAIRACLDSKRPDKLIQSHVLAASQEEIHATPTLKLLDHETSRKLVVRGPVAGDALLSAIDLLLSQEPVAGSSQSPD